MTDHPSVWTEERVRGELRRILVESLGVDEAAVHDNASLIEDLGAESIDFLDISFKAQQLFGVDLPTRLIQDKIIEWRNLQVLAAILAERYGFPVAAEDLRTVAPATLPAVLSFLEERYGLGAGDGAAPQVAEALARRLVSEMSAMGLDMSGVDMHLMTSLLLDNLHSPKAMEEVLRRFTVGALSRYLGARLAAACRLRDSE